MRKYLCPVFFLTFSTYLHYNTTYEIQHNKDFYLCSKFTIRTLRTTQIALFSVRTVHVNHVQFITRCQAALNRFQVTPLFEFDHLAVHAVVYMYVTL